MFPFGLITNFSMNNNEQFKYLCKTGQYENDRKNLNVFLATHLCVESSINFQKTFEIWQTTQMENKIKPIQKVESA